MRPVCKAAFVLSALVALGARAVPTHAQVVQLLSPAALTGGATVLFPEAQFTVLPSPYTLLAGVNTLTFTQSGSFVRLDQGTGWGGNFVPSTRLLYTGNNAGVGSGPVNISFAVPIFAFGFSIQNDQDAPGLFSFTAFNGATELATFSVAAGTSTSFLGASATGADSITRIAVSSTSAASGGANNFAFGPVTFQTIPEPGTLLLLGAGLVGFAAVRRPRRQAG